MANRPILRRVATAAANPVFVYELVRERLGGWMWTALFVVQCFVRRIPLGRTPYAYGRCILRKAPRSTISIGDNAVFVSSSWRSSTANCTNSKLRTFYPTASIIIGDRSTMTGSAIIARSKTIRIGSGCMLAPNVTIMDSDFHIAWPPERRNDTWETDIDQNVTLEDNVWVGTGTIILKGVTIGQNSIVAAGSIVVRDVPPNCIAGGNPARVLKTLG